MQAADMSERAGASPADRVNPATPSVALVTGGARGLGATVVRALAARGFAVAIHCHGSLVEARALAADVERTGRPALAVTANLRDDGPVRAMVHRVADHFGRIDVLVTTAMIRRRTVLEEVTADDLRSHFDVTCIGAFVCAQEVGAVMCDQATGGAIVLVGDDAATHPRADEVAAACAAGAIPALARALAGEYARRHPRVRVNAVVMRGAPSCAGPADPVPPGRAHPDGFHLAEAVILLVEAADVSGRCLTVEDGVPPSLPS
ncbi:MAG: SDR family NAD(P)-dependent oxidoreductase [Planctomycetia bacterium]|nr:SDR family NAD(P)-dependent oxidoreductase [Planctomycetia bacterium]